jgi:hypothetical protein
MTVFDGTATSPGQLPGDVGTTPPEGHQFRSEPDPTPEAAPVSSLDLLVKAVRERDAERDDLHVRIPIPGLDVRMVCRIDFPYSAWEQWQTLSIPKEKRRRPEPMDMRQNVLMTLALNKTCEFLEFKSGDTWAPITGASGAPMEYGSEEMLKRFNVMDEVSLLRALFGHKDGHILRAGRRVVAAAGYSDEADEREALSEADDDEADPLG